MDGDLIEFEVPKFVTSFSNKYNPNFTKELKDKCWSKCYELSNFKDKSYMNNIKNVGYFCSFMYPDCDSFKLEVLVMLFNYIFILDDHTEYAWGEVGRDLKRANLIWKQLSKMFDKFLGEKIDRIFDWKPYVIGFYSVFDTIFQHFNEDQVKRCIKIWKDFCGGNIKESIYYNNCDLIRDIPTIIDVSTIDILNFWHNSLIDSFRRIHNFNPCFSIFRAQSNASGHNSENM